MNSADQPAMAEPAVPARYRGVWRRTLLETPGARDTSTTVFWLQARRWHADIRLPAGRPDFSGIRSLAECGPAHVAWLAGQQGFAGVTTVSTTADGAEVCQWRRIVDFQPPPATPDAGAMQFRGSRLTETGVHAHYLEKWRRLPASGNGHVVLRLQSPDARPGSPLRLLMVSGSHVMHVRSRAASWPAAVAPGMALSDLVAGRNLALLDFEISFGRISPEGWVVIRSTLPWLENTTIAMQTRQLGEALLEVDYGGDVQCWQVLEWLPPDAAESRA